MSHYIRETAAVYGPRRMTVREYYLAAEKGIFKPGEKLELIHGEVYRKVSPQKSPHAATISIAYDLLSDLFGPSTSIRQQLPLRLDDWSEPEPDLLVIRGKHRVYLERHPSAGDVLLVVEVADTTLRTDRGLKARLYAEFGIEEYWIVNLRDNRLDVYREPRRVDSGWEYAVSKVHSRGETATPLKSLGRGVAVAGLLP